MFNQYILHLIFILSYSKSSCSQHTREYLSRFARIFFEFDSLPTSTRSRVPRSGRWRNIHTYMHTSCKSCRTGKWIKVRAALRGSGSAGGSRAYNATRLYALRAYYMRCACRACVSAGWTGRGNGVT